jgi:hypothetical protein
MTQPATARQIATRQPQTRPWQAPAPSSNSYQTRTACTCQSCGDNLAGATCHSANLAGATCHSAFYDDDVEVLESDEDSYEDRDLDDPDGAELAYVEYEAACAEWVNLDLPPEVGVL